MQVKTKRSSTGGFQVRLNAKQCLLVITDDKKAAVLVALNGKKMDEVIRKAQEALQKLIS